MFKKSIISVLKRAQKIVQDLSDIADTCDSEADNITESISVMTGKRNALRGEAERATRLAQKWSELV